MRKVSIPFDEIKPVNLKAGLLKDLLKIATKTLSSTSGVPGSRRGMTGFTYHVQKAKRT